jgi:hypothetical protein
LRLSEYPDGIVVGIVRHGVSGMLAACGGGVTPPAATASDQTRMRE